MEYPSENRLSTKQIRINGICYPKEVFTEERVPEFATQGSFPHQLFLFLKDWYSDSPTLKVQTSGSTGVPKEIFVSKTKMLQSARMTCEFFGLKENEKILLALPLEYIAGKMVVVRALYAGLDIYPIEPDGHPLAAINTPIDFAAMIPLQVYNSLLTAEEKQKLSEINHLIIGGGAIDDGLERELSNFPNAIYSTYGMTETLSHIALRQINGKGATLFYTPLPNVTLSLSEESTLIVEAPLVSDEKLTTNDIAEFKQDGRFRILGRKDNVINSGGVKIQIEEVERILRSHIKGNFAITCIPHQKLGEAVVLLTEAENEQATQLIKNLLPRYHQPLYIVGVPAIPLTGNGKTDRTATKKLAERICPASIL